MKAVIGAPAAVLSDALAACRRHFAFALLFSAMVNVLYLAPTIYMMQVYDRVVASGGVTTLVFITVAVAFALAVLAILDGVRARILARAGIRLDRLLAGEMLGRLLSRMHAGKHGARLAQAMREFDTFRQVLTGPAALAFFDAPWTPIYIFVGFMLHPVLGFLSLGGAVALLTLAVLNERATKSKLQTASEAQAVAYATQEAAASNADVVRALGMRKAMVARQLNDRRAAAGYQIEAQFGGRWYSGATRFLRLLLQSVSLGTGAWLAVKHEISTGSIIAASVLLSRALQPIESLVGAWSSIVTARSAYATVNELLSEGLAPVERTELPDPKGLIQVESVFVRAPAGEALILKNISMVIQPGQIVGLIGASGSGKTTLARVAAGAAPPSQGVVRLDGADYDDWDADRLGRHIGYMPQSTSLFAGTVRDNISRFEAAAGVDKSEVDALTIEAAKAAGVHEMILRLPEAYDTMLGLRGRGVSAGQAQRLALARALYRDPAVLILDEPNSSLDGEGETALMRALAAAKTRGAAILIVAHRTGVLALVDILAVMNEGTMEAAGPRDEIIERLNRREAQAAEAKPKRPGPSIVRAAGSGA